MENFKKKLVIVSELDSPNIGDQAIFQGQKHFFQQMGFQVEGMGLESGSFYGGIVPVGNQKSRLRRMVEALPHWMKSLIRKIYLLVWVSKYAIKLKGLEPKLSEIDIVVIGGGGLLMNNNWHFPVAMLLLTRKLNKIGIPYGFSGVSISPGFSKLCRYMFSKSLDSARFIHVRDPISEKIIKDTLLKQEVALGIDYALATIKDDCNIPKNLGPVKIGLNVVGRECFSCQSDYEDYLCKVSSVAKKLVDRYELILFTTGEDGDRGGIRDLLKKMSGNHDQEIMVHDEGCNLENLEECLKKCDFVIGTRLHSCIISLGLGLKCMALSINNKTLGFFRGLGLDCCVIDVIGLSSESVSSLVEENINKKYDYSHFHELIDNRKNTVIDSIRNCLG